MKRSDFPKVGALLDERNRLLRLNPDLLSGFRLTAELESPSFPGSFEGFGTVVVNLEGYSEAEDHAILAEILGKRYQYALDVNEAALKILGVEVDDESRNSVVPSRTR